MKKKTYVTPFAIALSVELHLLTEMSVTNGLNEQGTLNTKNRGVTFSDEDVLSREGRDDYWDDYDEE